MFYGLYIMLLSGITQGLRSPEPVREESRAAARLYPLRSPNGHAAGNDRRLAICQLRDFDCEVELGGCIDAQ
jgi:hypothetical protein